MRSGEQKASHRRRLRRRGAVCGVAAPSRCAEASPSSRRLASDPAALATPLHTLFQQPASAENAAKVFGALQSFGAPLQKISVDDLSTRGLIFQIGVAPNRIDILTAIDGVDFAAAWPAREETRYGTTPVPVLSRRDLLANKRATGRPQDLLDAEELERSG